MGIDFKVKTVFRQDKRVKLQIWVSSHRESRTGSWCGVRSFHSILILPRINSDEVRGRLLFKVLPLSYSTSKLEYSDIIRILV